MYSSLENICRYRGGENADTFAYPWAQEIERTIVQSIATAFGLDFSLFKDQLGGDVDTINNVRQKVYASAEEKDRFESRDSYNSPKYHNHINYIETGRRNKQLQQEGRLVDGYKNQRMGMNENRDLDHVISAKEVHDDTGRVLAEMDGVELANQSSNLQSTSSSINRSKKDKSMSDYLAGHQQRLEDVRADIEKREERLQKLRSDPAKNKGKIRELEDDIRKKKNKLNDLESIDEKAMMERDREARRAYNLAIDKKYYTSSKFFKKTAIVSGTAAVAMGARQALGLVCAEIWFELKESLPKIIDDLKNKFDLESFFEHIEKTLKGIWLRLELRFKEFFSAFKEGAVGGAMSSLTTTLFNVFATTSKNFIKIIRDMWGHLLRAIKLIVFNPENLSLVDLGKAVVEIFATAISAFVGFAVYAELTPLVQAFPLGAELASFAGALVTGLLALGLNYFLLYSSWAKKFWNYLEGLMPYGELLRKYREINAELDSYLAELAKIEFNLDAEDLAAFSDNLNASADEEERSVVLKKQVEKMGVELPFELGNSESVRSWLAQKAQAFASK
ncbi:MAG: hypothetical protein Q4A11_03555 [Brachymonas sp.]|nr:hypothetical protein [Brachymonas sp.]